jgi:hypothetical protein
LSLGFFQFHTRAVLFGEGGLSTAGMLAATGGAVDVVVIVTTVQWPVLDLPRVHRR